MSVSTNVAGDIKTLQSQWYNVIVSSLRLDPQSFQLVQATSPLPNTSAGIWEFFNSVPPVSLTQNYEQGSLKHLYDGWLAVVTTILPQGNAAGQWRSVMGDRLRDWEAFKRDKKPTPVYEAFFGWADDNLDPGMASKAKALWKQMKNDIVNRGIDAALDERYQDPDFGPKFSRTLEDLRDALMHGQSYTVDFNSATASSDTSRTWAKVELGALYPFFSSRAGGSYERLSRKATEERTSIEGSFASVVSFAATPYHWLDSGALALAYGTQDNTVWPAGQHPTWKEAFGPDGFLARHAAEMVAFDGMDLTLRSYAHYSSEEQEMIRGNESLSVWPFVYARSAGGYDRTVTFDSSGSMIQRVTSVKGNPAILGINVRDVMRLAG